MMDEFVLGAVVRLVARARQIVPSYAGKLAPIRTDQLAALSAGSGCRVLFFPFESDAIAVALPPFRGAYLVFVNSSACRTDRLFAWRHEIGHVLRGDVDEATYLLDQDLGYMSESERAADLFALADVIPGWWIETLDGEVEAEIRGAIVANYAADWPEDRVEDRARLRLRLYRECGI